MDLTVIGLVATTVAILLAIPSSVAANLLTPKVKNRWAFYSAERRTKRIREIEREIEFLSQNVSLRLEIVFHLGQLLFFSLAIIATALSLQSLLTVYVLQTPTAKVSAMILLPPGLFIVAELLAVSAAGICAGMRNSVSPKRLTKLKNTLDSLRSKTSSG